LAKFMNISAMGPSTELSCADKTLIMCWLQEKIPNSEIAARLGRQPLKIRRHVAVMKKLPPNSLPPPATARSRRPMKATDREMKRLKDFVQRFPFKMAREVKNNCPGWDSKSVRYIQYTLRSSWVFRPDLLPRNPC
jgi:hypothetical protein